MEGNTSTPAFLCLPNERAAKISHTLTRPLILHWNRYIDPYVHTDRRRYKASLSLFLYPLLNRRPCRPGEKQKQNDAAQNSSSSPPTRQMVVVFLFFPSQVYLFIFIFREYDYSSVSLGRWFWCWDSEQTIKKEKTKKENGGIAVSFAGQRIRIFPHHLFSLFFLSSPYALHTKTSIIVEPRPPLGLSDSSSTITTEFSYFSSQFHLTCLLGQSLGQVLGQSLEREPLENVSWTGHGGSFSFPAVGHSPLCSSQVKSKNINTLLEFRGVIFHL